MLRAPLWHLADKGKPASPQIANVRRLLCSDFAKSRVPPAAAGLPGDFKTVEQVDLDATNSNIKVKAARIAALVNEPPKGLCEIDETLIIINCNIFEHLAPETMCPTRLYDEMARTDTLICGSQAVVDKMYEVVDTETEMRLNDDFHAPRIGNMLRIPNFGWPMKVKPAGDPTVFNVRWLLIALPDNWSRKV